MPTDEFSGQEYDVPSERGGFFENVKDFFFGDDEQGYIEEQA